MPGFRHAEMMGVRNDPLQHNHLPTPVVVLLVLSVALAMTAEQYVLGYSSGGVSNTKVEQLIVTFEELVKLLKRVSVGPKDGAYLTRCAFSDNKRSNASALDIEAMVLDGDSRLVTDDGGVVTKVDGTFPHEQLHQALKEMDIPHILAPSFSDRSKGPEFFKQRIWVPHHFKNPNELEAAAAWLTEQLGQRGYSLVNVPENNAVSQAWYLPRCPTQEALETFKVYEHDGGQPFPIAEALAWYEEQVTATKPNPDLSKVESLESRTDTVAGLLRVKNSDQDILQLLQSHGYKYGHPGGVTDGHQSHYLTAPESHGGAPGIHVFFSEEKGLWVAYSHHAHGLLAMDKRAHDYLNLVAILECNGKLNVAIQQISNEIQRSKPFDDPVDLWTPTVAPSMTAEWVPSAIADLAKEYAEVSGFDYGGVAIAAITVCAGLIDDGIKINPNRNNPTWLESARIWSCLCGPPTTKKSPTLACASAPVHVIEARLAAEYKLEYAKYKVNHQAWTKDKSGAEPDKPIPRRVYTSDPTNEALTDILMNNKRGALILLNEAMTFIGGSGAYSSSNAGMVKSETERLELYDGGPKSFDRKVSGHKHVENWGTSVIGGSQPDVLSRHFAKAPNSGMVQRIIWCNIKPGREHERPLDLRAVNRYKSVGEALYKMKFDDGFVEPPKETSVHGMTGLPHYVSYSDEAWPIVKQVRTEIQRQVEIHSIASPRLAEHIGKFEGLYARLVLVYHCIGLAAGDYTKFEQTYPTWTKVPAEIAQQVGDLLFGYILPHTRTFHESVLGAATSDIHNTALVVADRILAKNWTEVTPSTLTSNIRHIRDMKPQDRSAVMQLLEDMNWIREVPVEQTGQTRTPKKLWIVNPRVHELFPARAEKLSQALRSTNADWAAARSCKAVA